MHSYFSSLLTTCLSFVIVINAQPLGAHNTTSSLSAQDPPSHPPFRYFKLLDNSNSTVTQIIADPAAEAVLWQGGPAISAGAYYWIDLAEETNNDVANGSSYKFGAAILGPNSKDLWDPNAYAVDLGSDKEALFVYEMGSVRLDSVYVKFQDGKKG